MSRRDEVEVRAVKEVAERAVRRLNAAEWTLLAAAEVLAIGGGAVVAFLLAGPLGASFRLVWIVASLVLFAVPGGVALVKMRNEDRAWREKSLTRNDETHV